MSHVYVFENIVFVVCPPSTKNIVFQASVFHNHVPHIRKQYCCCIGAASCRILPLTNALLKLRNRRMPPYWGIKKQCWARVFFSSPQGIEKHARLLLIGGAYTTLDRVLLVATNQNNVIYMIEVYCDIYLFIN